MLGEFGGGAHSIRGACTYQCRRHVGWDGYTYTVYDWPRILLMGGIDCTFSVLSQILLCILLHQLICYTGLETTPQSEIIAPQDNHCHTKIWMKE